MANFTSFIKNSTNVMNTIKEAAKDRHIKRDEIDFDLLSSETLIQSPKHKEWTIIEEPLEKIYSSAILRSETLQIKQEHKINIRPYRKNEYFNDINMEVAANKLKSKAIITFKKGSIFPSDKNLAKQLKREIIRKKLRLGFMVGHFEKSLNPMLIKFVKSIQSGSPLAKDIKIIIAEAPGAINPVNDSIIEHYKNKVKKEENKSKSLIDGVLPDELVFEYIKPHSGRDGRSCTGEYIVVPEPVIIYNGYNPDIKTIKIVEDELSIKYYSMIDGYVKDSMKKISISREVAMKAATFKNTGSIDTGEDKDVSVNIKARHSSDDAVGSGVKINVKELNVEGTVGANTEIKAKDLSIGEQTHRNSKLEAVENAKVHLHRGNLKAKSAEIEILENGTVRADDVKVKKMLGGEIIGHRVVVEELTSNTIITASESIEIGVISGDHNKLIINPNEIEEYHENVEKLKTDLKETKTFIRETTKEHAKRVQEHHERAERIKIFQKRVLLATKAGKAPAKPDMLKIRQYKKETEKLQAEAEMIKSKEKEVININLELEKLYEAELHAKIMNKTKYDGRTQVIFVDVKTSEKYTMSPIGIYEKIHLVKNGEEKKLAW